MSAILKEPSIDYQGASVRSKGYQIPDERLDEAFWFKPYIGSDDYYVSQDNIPTVIHSLWEMRLHKPLFDKPKEREYTFEVNGEIFHLPVNLNHIADSITEGKEILQYDDDWDDEGAPATDSNTFLKAAKFIIQYAVHIYKVFSVILMAPYIDILRDGSISVHWESTKNSQLFIIFDKKEDQPVIFYAEQGDRKIPLKGAIIPGDTVDESLTVWMKNYLHQ